MDEKTYTVADVAKYYHVTTHTVRNWIADGRLKAKRIGRPWIISALALQEADQAQGYTTNTENAEQSR
jgi:excisionase family DNA binding protein